MVNIIKRGTNALQGYSASPIIPDPGGSIAGQELTTTATGTYGWTNNFDTKVAYGPWNNFMRLSTYLQGVGQGPTGGPSNSYAMAFYVGTLRGGTGFHNMWEYWSDAPDGGWLITESETVSDRIGLGFAGISGASARVNVPITMTTGAHILAFSVNANGSGVRYSLDGAAVAALAFPGGTYVPVGGSGAGRWQMIGAHYNSLVTYQTIYQMAECSVWNALLVDADLITLSANYANLITGTISTPVRWQWRACNMSQGSMYITPTGTGGPWTQLSFFGNAQNLGENGTPQRNVY